MDSYDCVSFLDESGYLCLETDLPAVELCVQHVGGAKAERVYAAVRYANSTYEFRVHRWLQALCKVRVYNFGIDSRALAGLHEGFLVREVVFREGDEKAVGFVYAVSGYAPEDHIFLNAFAGAFSVINGIAGTAVEKTVVAAGGSGCNV